ncbi:MAG: Na+/H+ antiporter NhaC family protein [Mariniblastus sp.]|nr:Na+/H+ antiporter NhaC family protein [Mariniblastus sp.]
MNQTQPYVSPRPSLTLALIPIVVLIGLLSANVYLYGGDSSYGPNQIALLFASAAAVICGLLIKIPFKKMLEGVERAIGSALTAMLILLLIGSLAGTWMMSGVVPAMIYYGLDILDPKIFLFASAVICAIVSVATGSSWSTVATVGIALLGIGSALGVSEAMAAGAIISGAYFGDKISPLSDTTNLAAAMAGTELITHIKYMLWTTIPSFVIALVIYLAIGFGADSSALASDTTALKQEVLSHFDTLSPVLFLVPLSVLVMVVLKVDAVAALFCGAVLGGVFAIIFQPTMITKIAGMEPTENYAVRSYTAFTNSMGWETEGVSADDAAAAKESLAAAQLKAAKIQTSNPDLTMEEFEASGEILTEKFPELEAKVAAAKLLKGKGMVGMLNTIWLIITAMCFGGVMEATGLLRRITEPLIDFAKTTGSLIATTTGSCLFVNTTASDQYLAIVVPGRMFRETFEERGLAPQNLSRTLEDSGTVTSVLIPWNTCGAAQSGVLGVATLLYAPFCFFNLISPLMTILVGFMGIGIAKLDSEELQEDGSSAAQ